MCLLVVIVGKLFCFILAEAESLWMAVFEANVFQNAATLLMFVSEVFIFGLTGNLR